MAEHIFAWSKGSGDGGGPTVVVGNELALGPSAFVDCAGNKTCFINFEL